MKTLKTALIKRLQNSAVILSLCLSCALAGSATAGGSLPELSHRVHFELGRAEFAPGDSITIQDVRGTSDTIAAGQTFSVDGTYTLASRDEADLALFMTTEGKSESTPVRPEQIMRIKKGSGSFHLMKTITQDGYLHVSFYPRPSGSGFGGVYFGQGNGVLRSWSQPSQPASVFQPTAGTGPNQILIEYLGNPVEPPPNLDGRYTKEGLLAAMETAARNAGVTVKRTAIDDSEFPFLVGVVCGGADAGKLKGQLRKMAGYEYGGGTGNDANSDGSDTCNVFSVVPPTAYPPGTFQQIYHRLLLREQVFYARLSGRE